MTREIVFAPEALEDLVGLHDFVARRSDPARADAFALRIVAYCESFAIFPERGTRRDDIRPRVRVVGFERRVTIAFAVTGSRVTILRVLYRGRNVAAELA